MKHCPNCGASVEGEQKFCGECGAKLAFDPLPTEPVYTDDERLKNDPVLNRAQDFTMRKKKGDKIPELTLEPDLWGTGATAAAAEPAGPELPKGDTLLEHAQGSVPKKKEDKIPELTLEPDLWGMGAAAVAAAPAEAAQAAEAAPPASAAAAAQAAVLAVEEQTASGPAQPVQDFDYERPDAEYHGPAQGTQGDFRANTANAYNTLPNDYTMSGNADKPAKKIPDETLMLIWSIILTCMFSVCGIVGLVKTIKARSAPDFATKSKLLGSAQVWLIVGTVLRLLPLLGRIF